MPCVGIDGCGTALQAMGVEFKANNVLDLEHRYGKYLEEHLQQRNIYVGKKTEMLPLSNSAKLRDQLISWCQGHHARHGLEMAVSKVQTTLAPMFF